jgi:hypothetical protein
VPVVSTGANSVCTEVFHIYVQGLKETAWTLSLKVSKQINISQPFKYHRSQSSQITGRIKCPYYKTPLSNQAEK